MLENSGKNVATCGATQLFVWTACFPGNLAIPYAGQGWGTEITDQMDYSKVNSIHTGKERRSATRTVSEITKLISKVTFTLQLLVSTIAHIERQTMSYLQIILIFDINIYYIFFFFNFEYFQNIQGGAGD